MSELLQRLGLASSSLKMCCCQTSPRNSKAEPSGLHPAVCRGRLNGNHSVLQKEQELHQEEQKDFLQSLILWWPQVYLDQCCCWGQDPHDAAVLWRAARPWQWVGGRFQESCVHQDFTTPWTLTLLVHSPNDPAGKTWRRQFSPPTSSKAVACPVSQSHQVSSSIHSDLYPYILSWCQLTPFHLFLSSCHRVTTCALLVCTPQSWSDSALLGSSAVARLVQGDAQGRGGRKREELLLIHLQSFLSSWSPRSNRHQYLPILRL